MPHMELSDFRSQWESVSKGGEEDAKEWLELFWSRLPLFPEENRVREMKTYHFHGKEYLTKCALYQNCEEVKVDPRRCVGNTWLFNNDLIFSDSNLQRLTNCLLLPSETVPCFWGEKMGNYYFCSDGNRRIYAAYLLGHNVNIRVDGYYPEVRSK